MKSVCLRAHNQGLHQLCPGTSMPVGHTWRYPYFTVVSEVMCNGEAGALKGQSVFVKRSFTCWNNVLSGIFFEKGKKKPGKCASWESWPYLVRRLSRCRAFSSETSFLRDSICSLGSKNVLYLVFTKHYINFSVLTKYYCEAALSLNSENTKNLVFSEH